VVTHGLELGDGPLFCSLGVEPVEVVGTGIVVEAAVSSHVPDGDQDGVDKNMTDVGPAPQPPDWCPDAQPILFWHRPVGCALVEWYLGPWQVWVACEDHCVGGQMIRTDPRVFYSEAPRGGMDTATARRFAAALLEAADVLDGRPETPQTARPLDPAKDAVVAGHAAYTAVRRSTDKQPPTPRRRSK
jgi:hypothetical protein